MNELNNEELRQMIIDEMNKTYTIKDAIESQIEEREMIKESFSDIKQTYKTTSECRRAAIKSLNILRLRLLLHSLYANIFNNYVSDLLSNINNKTNDIKRDFKKEKYILVELKKAIDLLEEYNTIICNYEISNVLVLLLEKYQLMLVDVLNELEIYNCAIRGINYLPASNYDTRLQLINDEIEKSLNDLGLKK